MRKKRQKEFLKKAGYGNCDWYEKIEYLEMEFDREKRWVTQMQKSKKQQELINRIPDAPENIREWLYEKESEEEYIFYDKSKGKWGCSCCGAEIPDAELKRLSDGKKSQTQ